jgi:hypothetical protein
MGVVVSEISMVHSVHFIRYPHLRHNFGFCVLDLDNEMMLGS